MLYRSECVIKGFFGVNKINEGPDCRKVDKWRLFIPDG